jgi:glycosyltransferase involved in cell wall biosynthesis
MIGADIKTNTNFSLRVLVVLFGTLEFDGRAQRMIEVLKQVGADITLIDIEPYQSIEPCDSSSITRIGVKIPQKTGKVYRHIKLLKTTLIYAKRIRPNIVVAENFFTIMTARLAAKITNAKLIYDAYELIIPENGRHKSWRDQFWYSMERWSIKGAVLVIVANEERARIMTEHYRLKIIPAVMRNIPVEQSSEISEEEVLKRYPVFKKRRCEEKLILYQGDVSLLRGLGRFLVAVSYLSSDYRMVIVGDGPDLEKIKEIGQPLIKEGRLNLIGRVPSRRLITIASLADVGIVTYPFEGLNNVYCAPNKIFEYARAGLPVVTSDQPPLRQMVETYQIGACVGEHDSVEEVAKVIQNIAIAGKESFAIALDGFLADNRWENDASIIISKLKTILNQREETEIK